MNLPPRLARSTGRPASRSVAVLVWLLALGLAGCGKESPTPVAAGGFGSETTNGVQVRGQTEPGTVITARRLDGSGQETAIRTDSVSGTWSATLEPGEWMLVGRLGDDAFGRYLALAGTDRDFQVGTLRAERLSTVFGRVRHDPAGLRVVVEGTDHAVAVDPDSTFGMDRIPRGTYMLGLYQGSRLLQRRLVSTAAFVEFDPQDPSLLLGNFDDDWGVNPLSPLLAGGWTILGDSNLVDTTGTVPDYWVEDRLQEDGAWNASGKSLHLRTRWIPGADTTHRTKVVYSFGGRWGTTTTSLWDELHPIFASDSLVFWARGDAPLGVYVGIEPLDRTGLDMRCAMGRVSLRPEWTRHAIAWSDFTLDGVPVGNNFRLHLAGEIRFEAGAGDFWLDGVAITPASPEVFWR